MKAIVVEDSRLAREGLMSLLAQYPDIELIGSADHPDSALEMLAGNVIDVIFLDIHMPGSSGFELLEGLDYSPLIIFTTAYSEHAIRSFDFNTVDYLLKPISRDRLNKAIMKLKRHFLLSAISLEELKTDSQVLNNVDLEEPVLDINSRMFVHDNEQCHLVDLKVIRYFESCKNYARLYFDDSNAFIKTSLSNLEKRLPVQHFFRCNRQYIVNLHEVKDIVESENDHYYLLLKEGKQISISRRHLVRLKGLLSF